MSSRRPIGPAFLAAVFVLVCGVAGVLGDYYPIHVGFMSHMHQPVYYPYESIIETEAAQRFSFSVIDVHNQRFRPCTTWPRAAVPAGLGLPHLGVQLPPSVNGDGNVNAAEYAAFEWRAVDDMNCDAMPDFGDINPFVLYLPNFASWQTTFPGCNPRNGDINDDGTYAEGSFGDINPFVALLSSGAPS